MRTLLILLPLLALLLGSCEEPFSPKAPFVARPVVICLVSASEHAAVYRLSASATVATTYDVPGLDPLANTTDPFDANAVVTMTVRGETDKFRLFQFVRSDTARYTSKEKEFHDNGKFASYTSFAGSTLSLDVTTGSGEKLWAETTVPWPRAIDTDYKFVAGVTAVTVQPTWTFNWDYHQRRDDHLYFPKMQLSYQIIDGASVVDKKIEIPLTYVEKDGKKIPVYPTFTHDFQVTYDFSALTTAMASISEGDTVKSRYKIGWLSFTLVEYDINLTKYYSSAHGYLDAYSVRVDETTYSNISGGIGVFGSYFANSTLFEMKVSYVRSFGYRI